MLIMQMRIVIGLATPRGSLTGSDLTHYIPTLDFDGYPAGADS